MKNIFKTQKTIYKKGFSLVELLVVTLIFFILTGIVLFRQGKFSSDILITSTAYELALFIREAQVYGVGSKVNSSFPSNSRLAYGVRFSDTTAGRTEAVMFADVPKDDGTFDYTYDEGVDIMVNTIAFKRDQVIDDFCGIPLLSRGEDPTCKNADGLSSLYVSFVKPDLNAKVFGAIGSGSEIEYKGGATIKIRSSLGDKCRTIRINPLGQISIDPASMSGPTGCESS